MSPKSSHIWCLSQRVAQSLHQINNESPQGSLRLCPAKVHRPLYVRTGSGREEAELTDTRQAPTQEGWSSSKQASSLRAPTLAVPDPL